MSSPFARENGNIRQKTIAAHGADETKRKKLSALGYEVVTFGDDAADYKELQDVPSPVDAVWVGGNIPKTIIEAIIQKEVHLLFAEQAENNEETVEYLKAANIYVVTRKNPYDEALRLRGSQKETPVFA